MENVLLDIDGIQLNYYICGNVKGPTIICLHGLAGSATYSFAELITLLSDHFYVIAIDQPGHGKSTSFKNEEDYLFSKLAKFYERVFEKISDKPFYLLGHSWGADVALNCAKQFPSKLKGIILLDGGFTFPEFQKGMTFSIVHDAWNNYMEQTKFYQLADIFDFFKRYTKRWNRIHEQSLSTIFMKKEKYELIASKFTVLSIIKAFFEEPFSSTYPFISSPLLLIHATEPIGLDVARARGISQLQNDIKDVTIVSLSGTGHMVQWDEPSMVSEKITSWVIRNKDS